MHSPVNAAQETYDKLTSFIDPERAGNVSKQELIRAIADRNHYQLRVRGYWFNLVEDNPRIDVDDVQKWLTNSGVNCTDSHNLTTNQAEQLLQLMANLDLGKTEENIFEFNEDAAVHIMEISNRPTPEIRSTRPLSASFLARHLNALDTHKPVQAIKS